MSGSWKSSLLVGIVAMIFVAVLTVQVQRVTNQVSEAGLQVSAADQKLLIQNLVAERLDKLKAIYPFSSLMTETEAPEQFRLLAQLAVDPQGDVVVRRLRRWM